MPEAAPRDLKVLVVGDEPAVLKLVERVLVSAGYRVFPAKNGKDALALCEQIEPDMVLSDVSMPEMNGIELARCISRLHKAVPIILMSGCAQNSTLLADITGELTQYRFLAKPFLPKDLIAAMSGESCQTGVPAGISLLSPGD